MEYHFVSDNNPSNSSEFRNFSKEYDFNVVFCSPNYPQSRAFAEKGVQIAKTLLEKCVESHSDMYVAVLEYRNCPVKGMNASPAQLLMSRITRTPIPISEESLKPKVVEEVPKRIEKQNAQNKKYYDKHSKENEGFKNGQKVLVWGKNEWVEGIITEKLDTTRSYLVKLNNGELYQRTTRHIKSSDYAYDTMPVLPGVEENKDRYRKQAVERSPYLLRPRPRIQSAIDGELLNS